MSTREHTRSKQLDRLLSIWSGREDQWLTYKEIIDESAKLGLNVRTVARWLNVLVNSEELSRQEKGYNKTFYKPNRKKVLPSLKLVNEQEEYMCNDIKDIIAEKFEKTMTWYEVKGRANKPALNLSQEELDKLGELIQHLADNLKTTLAQTYLDGKNDPYTVYDRLAANLTKLISAEMELWAFISEKPAAAEEFKAIIEKGLKSQ